MTTTCHCIALDLLGSTEPFLGKIGDGTKFGILMQEGGANLLRDCRDPGVSKREGMAGLDPGGWLQQGL